MGNKIKKINRQNIVDNILFKENKYNVVPLKKDNTTINNRNFIENIELPNIDIRTWNELSPEEQQKLIDAVPKPIIDNYKGFDMRKAIAAKRYNNAKGYTTFETRTGKQILKDRDDYQTYQILKYFDEQNAKNNENKNTQFKCGGMKRVPRKKAFWGALIGAAVSAIGGGISAAIQAKKNREIAENNLNNQKAIMNKMDEQNRQAAEQQYANQLNSNSGIYKKLYEGTVSAKMGGKFKKCRKKAAWGADDTGNLISSLINTIGGVTTNTINANNQLETSKLALQASGRIGKQYNYATPVFNNIEESINEKVENSNVLNEIQKRRRGQLNSLYLS